MKTIEPKSGGRWDLVSLGEVMLRFDPGDKRVSTTRSFDVYEGGGEYNVARGLKRCFGLNAAIVTALVDNAIGHLVQDLIYQGGVDQSLIRWVEFDGLGRTARNGLNFTERGFGVRAALGCSDRGHTASSQLKPGDVDWDAVFGTHGSRWFHTGGIFCGLSDTTPEVALEAMQAAKRHGTVVSYDLNYRDSLWRSRGGKKRAEQVNRRLAPFVDVIFGDFSALGFEMTTRSERPLQVLAEELKELILAMVKEFKFKAAATTLRKAKTATINDFGALCYGDGNFYQATTRSDLQVFDCVGAGDAFAAGLIYGFLTGREPQASVELGAAHGALTMTTPGDNSMVTMREVLQLIEGAEAGIAR